MSRSVPKISFQFSGPGSLKSSMSTVDMRVSGDSKENLNLDSKKSRVLNDIFKLMEDSIAQRHILLQQHCLRALDGDSAALGDDASHGDESDLDPITEICVINEKMGEKRPEGFDIVGKSPSGIDAHILKSSGGRFLLCVKREKEETSSISVSVSVSGGASGSTQNIDSPPQSVAESEDSGQQNADEKVAPSSSSSFISDVRIVRMGEVPFGFTPILKTATGMKINAPWVVCFSRQGLARVKSIRVIFPAHNEKVPTGHIFIKADLNEGASDNSEAYLTVLRDLDPYYATLEGLSKAEGVNSPTAAGAVDVSLGSEMSLHTLMDDPKYIPPFLTACHLMEPVLGTVAILSLQKLIDEGFLLDPSNRDTPTYISSIVQSVNDALASSEEPNFQMEVLNLLRIIISKHHRLLSVDVISSMIISSFRVGSKGVRHQFLEHLVDVLVRGYDASASNSRNSPRGNGSKSPNGRGDHSPSRHSRQRTAFSMSTSYRPKLGAGSVTEEGCRTIALELVENVVTAKRTERLIKKFRALSILDPSFRDVVHSSVNFLFATSSERKLGAAILILSKLGTESEGSTVALKYKFGVSRKHSALRILLYVLDRMYEAAGGVIQKQLPTDASEEDRILAANKRLDELQVPAASSVAAMLGGHQMNKTFAFLFRRYVCPTFFTSLLPVERAGTQDHASIQSFNLVLAFFTVLSDRYTKFFKNELGVFLNEILLELAENTRTPTERRFAIVSTLKGVFSPLKKIVNLYYNYDNIVNWSLTERLIEVMGNILMEAKPNSNPFDATSKRPPQTRARMGTVEFDSAISLVDHSIEEDDVKDDLLDGLDSNGAAGSHDGAGSPQNEDTVLHPSSEAYINQHAKMSAVDPNTGARLEPHDVLKLACLELLVLTIRSCDLWYVQQQEKLHQHKDAIRTNSAKPNGKAEDISAEEWGNMRELARMGSHRKGTVLHRQKKNAGNKMLLQRALRLAKTKTLAKALAYLEGVNFLAHDAEAHVDFIVTQSALGKLDTEMVGEYLGGKRPKQEEPFMEEIRLNFIRRLSMFNLNIVQGLRQFLVEGGFRLPAEAQKIERLLESFSDVYVQENPSAFKDADACYIMATAVLMLNTSLHNPNLKEKDRLTKRGFCKMCLGIEGTGLDKSDYEDIFDDIQGNGFKIEITANISTRQQKKKGETDHALAQQEREKYARQLASWVRRAETFMSNNAIFHPHVIEAYSPDVVVSLWQTTWMQYSYILSNVLNSPKSETRMISTCLDGFKHSLRLATRLSNSSWRSKSDESKGDGGDDGNGDVERESFIQALAKFSFYFQNEMLDAPRPRGAVNLDIVKGLHMEQEWVQTMMSLSADPGMAVPAGEVIDDLKKEYIREKNFKELRGVQSRLSGDENVVMQGRYFIREGNIGKVCGNGETRQYRLFLFSDAALYASETGTGAFKTHRVILLAFATVVNVPDSPSRQHMFRLISPQKTVVFYAKSARSKQAWLENFQRGIQKEKSKRISVIRTARECANSLVNVGVPQAALSRIENTAAFLHRDPEAMKKGDLSAKLTLPNHCHLCMRAFSFFNRSQRCPMCLDDMCGKCITRKVGIPATKRKAKICDGCYGLTKQFENRRHSIRQSVSINN